MQIRTTHSLLLHPTQEGDTVVYSKFGMGITELDIQGTTYALMREDDIIGTMPSSATAADVPKIKPIGDRVLIKVRATHFGRVASNHTRRVGGGEQ